MEKQQLQATNSVYAAIKVVRHEQEVVDAKREKYGKTTLALKFATAQENAAQGKVNEAANKRSNADSAQSRAH